MRVAQKVKRRLSWSAIVTVFMLGVLGMSVAGYSETYNFYFEKKKTEGKEEESAPVVPQAPPAAAAPIVINNNNTNNVGTPSANTTNNNTGVATGPTILPQATTTGPTLVAPSTLVTTESGAFARPSERSPWRMAVTGMAFLQEYPKSYVSQGEKKSYKNLEPTWGGLLTVGYNFSRFFGVSVYGGLRVTDFANKKTYGHLGWIWSSLLSEFPSPTGTISLSWVSFSEAARRSRRHRA